MLNYETKFTVRGGKNKKSGWLMLRTNIKPERFTFVNDLLVVEFKGYVVHIFDNQQAGIIRYPWADIDIFINVKWEYGSKTDTVKNGVDK